MTRLKVLSISIFLGLCIGTASADILDLTTGLADALPSFKSDNEGTTTFRSLTIPTGGRSESLAGAFSAVADDINFFESNPAASCVIKNTEVAAFHNSWIADSNMETLAATTRFDHLGLGAQLKCFYVPFSEYNIFGEKVASSYYSETTFTANGSYNFFPGYKFRGLAIGANAKMSWRAMPDYTDNNTNEIISGSGLEQSALAVLFDIGALVRFNFAKFYTDRDNNFAVSLVLQNVGVALTGFGKSVELDDSPTTKAVVGVSYRPFSPILLCAEFRQNLNLFDFSKMQGMEVAAGVGFSITRYFQLLGGLSLKGGNPCISIGGQFDINRFSLNANYSLDLTTSTHPINHISLSMKVNFGDKGRSEKQKLIDQYYTEGLDLYASGDLDGAILKWEEALKLDKYFDPVKDALKAVQNFKEFYKNITDLQNLN